MPRAIIPRTHSSTAPYEVPSRSEHSNSPAPTVVSRSSATAESCSPPAVFSQNAFIIRTHQSTGKSSPFTAAGERYPYVKGKKVSAEQLSQLLTWFAEDDNPSKEQRVTYANQLEMSFKAISIWYQNERANVKKGRSRVSQAAAAAGSTPVRSINRPTRSIRPRSYSYDGTSDEDETSSNTDDGYSDETIELDTPRHSLKELPRIDIVHADANGPDDDAIIAARILVRMKYSL